jgi:hypothetical protein
VYARIGELAFFLLEGVPDVDSLTSKRFDSLLSKCTTFYYFLYVIR